MTGKTKNSKEYIILHENKDYLLVEDALKVLKIQLAQAEKDIVKLKAYKEKALKDPIGFVENLIDKKYKNIPRLQKVISIPNIDLSTYKPHSLRHTRSSSNNNNSNTNSLFKDITYSKDTSPTSPNSNKKRLFEEDENNKYNDTFYSETWTDEEINQLWNLLEVYPEEDVPMSRYIKIAKRLETKSPKQVEKKVQTLSKKRRLTRKNLKPQKIAAESKIKAEKTLYSNRFSGAAYLSTPTVYMSDEEDGATLLGTGSVSMTSAAATATVDLNSSQSTRGRSNQRIIVNDDDSNDEDYEEPVSKPRRLHSMNTTGYSTRAASNSHTSTYMTRSSSLPLRGSRLNEDKKNKKLNSVTKPDMNNIHYGIQCDRCGIEPIVGIRYKCKVCQGDHQTDLCEDCISKNYENEYHKASHEFDRIEKYIPEDNKTTVASDQYSYLGFSRQL